MKKKIFISAYNLDIGGIETSLLNMLKNFDLNKYSITLMLSKKEGIFLKDIPKEIEVIEYKINNNKNVILRKISNRLKLIVNIFKYKNKYDFGMCYATHIGPEGVIARNASKNNALWIHSNYYEVYKKDLNRIKKFFDDRHITKYKKIVFVSNESKQDLCKIYPEIKTKSYILGNIIDYKKIEDLSNEKVNEKLGKPLIVFIGRLEEESKKISLLINSLNNIQKNYECLIIGDGPDKNMYEKLINEKGLNNKIKLLGKKENPYPYVKSSDLVVLTSNYEGFPVVLMESLILNKPFLSTINVSNKYINLKDYGFIVDSNDFEKELSNLLNKKISLKKSFDMEEYTKNIVKDLEKLMEVSK